MIRPLLFVFFIASAANAAPTSKTLVYCSEGSPSSFNPQVATDGTTFTHTKSIYNRLVEFEYGGTNVVPALAESWKVSADGKTYTFKLRKGVKFHSTEYFKPSRDFNAEDVLFSFNRMFDPQNPYHKVGGGSYEYFTGMNLHTIIKAIKKIDDYTVQFELNVPEAPFIANIAMDFASIVSKEYADQLASANQKEKLDHSPVGTGPFKYVRYVKDQIARYEAHPDFYLGKAKIDKLVFAITQDANVRFQKLKAGECDFIAYPAMENLSDINKTPNVKLASLPGFNVGYLAMNVEKKPYDNAKVRQAVNYALNRKAYIDAIYLGHAQVAKNPLPPTAWSYNDGIKDYSFDPEKAKALLKEAGFANGFETELWTLPVSRPYNPNGKKMGEMMQADLAKVGIKAKLVSYDWPTYLEKSKKGEHQMLQMGWTGDNGDPDNFLFMLLSCAAIKDGSNRARWCDPNFDKLVTDAKQNSKKPFRTNKYMSAQQVFKTEAPWVPIAHSIDYRAMSKSIVGFKMDPFGTDSFYPVDIKK